VQMHRMGHRRPVDENELDDIAQLEHERRLRGLLSRLPVKIQAIARWLRRPGPPPVQEAQKSGDSPEPPAAPGD
jgi:hypothetical protein